MQEIIAVVLIAGIEGEIDLGSNTNLQPVARKAIIRCKLHHPVIVGHINREASVGGFPSIKHDVGVQIHAESRAGRGGENDARIQ